MASPPTQFSYLVSIVQNAIVFGVTNVSVLVDSGSWAWMCCQWHSEVGFSLARELKGGSAESNMKIKLQDPG